MIYGIGTDLVEPARIARLLERYGERFARRLLADEEWPEYLRSSQPAMFLAKRFAAKEALSKAMGTGMRAPVSLNHIGIVHDSLGKPGFTFHPVLDSLVQSEGITRHHLSISDELNLACAFVILEAEA
ncbi:holo-ACP synthase [Nitrosovibrio sp. Nv17]|uniref:holo-ACP synthase n=1 Tax=Nitrosovibrio sp. Nv17 TaxID=1855339 RepID=UPI000908C188|nr:holo-ACP synthase [Nitrosovibrio sp. Nv17]SFW13272.1 holo-[acyl-carrier protein] synthase [Nitrosovibrio sp. Nv17]